MIHDKMIVVIQAHKNGKKLQRRQLNGLGRQRDWIAFLPEKGDCWDFSAYEFRIKPEEKKPRELWLREESQNSDYLGLRQIYVPHEAGTVGATKFREVLEEEAT